MKGQQRTDRRHFLRAGLVAGSAWLVGCPEGVSSIAGSTPTETPVSWGTAFARTISSRDREILRDTPVVVDQVSTEAEVKTALGVLAWTRAAESAPDASIEDLKTLARTAGEVRQQLLAGSQHLESGLELVEAMKETAVGSVSVWDAATTAAPSLAEFETAARELNTELERRAQQAAAIESATSAVLSYFRQIRASRVTDYGQLPRAVESAVSEYDRVIREVAEGQETIRQLQQTSVEAAEIAGGLPDMGDEVEAFFETLHTQLTALNETVERFRTEIEARRNQLVEARRTAAQEANRRYGEISEMATGSGGEMNVTAFDTSVGAYDSEMVGTAPTPTPTDATTRASADATATAGETPATGDGTQTAASTPDTGVFSFESLDPWSVRNSAGTIEPSTEFVSHGSQSLHMASYREDLKTTEVAIRLDLTAVERLRYDAYVEANNPNWGDIKINLDGLKENGRTVSNELVNGFPPEDQWYRDVEVDLSQVTGEHLLILWVRGNGNDVYWDNLRFLDASGTVLPPARIVVG